jgi:hypothetical protein
MATVVDEYTTEEQSSVVRFLWVGLNAKDIHKEMCPVYGGKCLSHSGSQLVDKFSQGRSKVADDAGSGGEVAEKTEEDFHAAGCDAMMNRLDMCINVDGRYVEK